jgi:hypothetical protein
MKSSFLFLSVFLILSCKQTVESIEVSSDFNPQELAVFMVNPDQIPKEKIANLVGTEVGKLKIFNDEISSNVSERSILFSWPNGEFKTQKISDSIELKLDDYSSIGLGYLRKISMEEFQNRFESKDFIQKKIESISKDSTIQSELAIMEMKDLAENHKHQTFQKLDNLGELAYWEKPLNALHVYNQNAAFTISTNMKNESESKKIALKIVELLIQELHEN